MAGTDSAVTYVKNEPEEYRFDPNRLMSSANTMNSFQHPQPFSGWNMDISDLNMPQSFGSSQQNMPSNFIAGSSGIADDELEDLLNLPDSSNTQASAQQPRTSFGNQAHMQQSPGFHSSGMATGSQSSVAVPVSQRNPYVTQMYSNTPEGAPMNSSFVNSFNYSQWAMQQQQQQQPQQQQQQQQQQHQHPHPHQQHQQPQSQPQSSSSTQRPSGVSIHSSNAMHMRHRTSMASQGTDSQSRSPMTPKTPAGLGQFTPDSSNFSAPGIQMVSSHRKSLSSQWDGLPNGSNSYTDSPIASPVGGAPMVHRLSAASIHGGKPASLPTKVDGESRSVPTSTLEAKRQKRRQSHNAVERRRRDNINDRIQELSRLVPQHRLEDDKVRKQLNSHNVLSPGLGGGGSSSMSPTQATSLLAGGTGRRATTLGQGLSLDDKDKGPAKGDVLNGAVGWTRDLMWMLYRKIEQQQQLVEHIESLGSQVPFDIPDDEARMESELIEAFQKNSVVGFEYSRTNGSGLFVPSHTDHAGTPISGGSKSASAPPATNKQPADSTPNLDAENAFWGYSNDDSGSARASLELKEEDEFGMDIE